MAWAAEREDVRVFPQGLAPRLTDRGAIYRDADGKPSFSATGHGDFPVMLRDSGLLRELRADGVETVLMVNVDNVGAVLDPLIYGLHLLGGAAISVEVAPRKASDRGGLPLRHRGRPRIVEDYLLPDGFDASGATGLNTNTMWIELEALEADFELSWVTARKQHEGAPVIQFERLVGELTAFASTRFLMVDREGPRGRFQPIKHPDDLEAAAAWAARYHPST